MKGETISWLRQVNAALEKLFLFLPLQQSSYVLLDKLLKPDSSQMVTK